MVSVVYVVVFWVAIAFAVFWLLRKIFTSPKAPEPRAPDWQYTDFDPPDKPHHDRTPDHVEHSLDLVDWEYFVYTVWINDDPYAESDTSVVRERFDVRRPDSRRWEIRLSMRNGVAIENEPWQSAPKAFVGEWESAYSHLDRSREALLDS